MPFEARVKSVLSGDTVVLSHVTNPSQERILSLAYVSAPRLRREGDEVGALLGLIVFARFTRKQLVVACMWPSIPQLAVDHISYMLHWMN
jgi:hypothetical protein